jgi:hypothetical protein
MGWRVCGDGVCIEKIEKPNNLKANKFFVEQTTRPK